MKDTRAPRANNANFAALRQTVWPYVGSQSFVDAGGPPTWDGGRGFPPKNALLRHVSPYQISSPQVKQFGRM